ncbi:hypothetical protein B9T19_03610 [Ignatzschineria sp. F8392]|uniref:hypothetical protein n=1 Tax=Ignatzschineria sp. F8392 TaxID=1980117 RepID=UPI000B985EF1|nr:hypothetical protein [Ignatzschineria sp. F8392]OYQ81760.1 hypothetical protein B9T19_03610 [Ignatzschineria sp. F8392]
MEFSDESRLEEVYLEFKGKIIELSNNSKGITSIARDIDPSMVEIIEEIAKDIVVLIPIMGSLHRIKHRSIFYNMQLVCSILDELNNYISLIKNDIGYRSSVDCKGKILIDMTSALVCIASCLNNIKVDLFFFEDGFLGKSPSEYHKLIDIISVVENFEDEILIKKEKADELLSRMKLTEKAILKVGLAKAFKQRVSGLFWRILGLDLFNYTLLFSVFFLTLGIIIDLENLNFLAFLKLKNIGVYERFMVIIPLLLMSWFVSKRSQFLYQIKEEYSYKQTSALAYEAYKNEVEKDEHMLNKLLDITIDNLGKSPLEQLDKNSDHSPYIQFIKEFKKKGE